MRAVVQRVNRSFVAAGGKTIGEIGKGLTVLLGVEEGDTDEDANYMAGKITGLLIFEDSEGKMNLSLAEAGGDMLVVSQFTLLGDCRKGKRPGFTRAAKPETAIRLYKDFIEMCRSRNIRVEEGTFRAEMMVHIENDGPVTLILDSRKLF